VKGLAKSALLSEATTETEFWPLQQAFGGLKKRIPIAASAAQAAAPLSPRSQIRNQKAGVGMDWGGFANENQVECISTVPERQSRVGRGLIFRCGFLEFSFTTTSQPNAKPLTAMALEAPACPSFA
jgi:hypothetical protein